MVFESPFKLRQLRGNFLIHGQRFAHAHERADHEDAHPYSSLGIQHRCRHDGAVFGEGMWEIAPPAVAGI